MKAENPKDNSPGQSELVAVRQHRAPPWVKRQKKSKPCKGDRNLSTQRRGEPNHCLLFLGARLRAIAFLMCAFAVGLRIGGGEISVVATGGDKNLGGFDWDNALMTHLNEQFKAAGGPDLLDDPEQETTIKPSTSHQRLKTLKSKKPFTKHCVSGAVAPTRRK
jgi:hypothetical protein